MSAWAVNLLASVAFLAAGSAVPVFDCKGRSSVAMAALCAAFAASLLAIGSAIVMMDGWTAQVAHVDFTEASKLPIGKGGPEARAWGIYLWPYKAAAIDAVAALVLGQMLYERIRGVGPA